MEELQPAVFHDDLIVFLGKSSALGQLLSSLSLPWLTFYLFR